MSLLADVEEVIDMDPRRRALLGNTGADDGDVRGEHEYPGETLQVNGKTDGARPVVQRSHYAAGADGTQMVSEPEAATPIEEDR